MISHSIPVLKQPTPTPVSVRTRNAYPGPRPHGALPPDVEAAVNGHRPANPQAVMAWTIQHREFGLFDHLRDLGHGWDTPIEVHVPRDRDQLTDFGAHRIPVALVMDETGADALPRLNVLLTGLSVTEAATLSSIAVEWAEPLASEVGPLLSFAEQHRNIGELSLVVRSPADADQVDTLTWSGQGLTDLLAEPDRDAVPLAARQAMEHGPAQVSVFAGAVAQKAYRMADPDLLRMAMALDPTLELALPGLPDDAQLALLSDVGVGYRVPVRVPSDDLQGLRSLGARAGDGFKGVEVEITRPLSASEQAELLDTLVAQARQHLTVRGGQHLDGDAGFDGLGAARLQHLSIDVGGGKAGAVACARLVAHLVPETLTVGGITRENLGVFGGTLARQGVAIADLRNLSLRCLPDTMSTPSYREPLAALMQAPFRLACLHLDSPGQPFSVHVMEGLRDIAVHATLNELLIGGAWTARRQEGLATFFWTRPSHWAHPEGKPRLQ